MKKFGMYFVFFQMAFLLSCMQSESKFTVKELLNFSERTMLPVQEEYPDDGAVVLFEKEHINLKLDDAWEPVITRSYHIAMVYFNDKAESFLSNTIYLDSHRSLVSFYARTIHPDGSTSELTEKDLIQTHVSDEYYEFSDEKSVKFTFPAVRSGDIIEFSFVTKIADRFYNGDTWFIQQEIPKLYTAYSVELPDIFAQAGFDWNFMPVNIELGPPKSEKFLNTSKRKDHSHLYYWELRDVPALRHEPNMPPYRDAAKYVRIGFKYDNWNKLTDGYWKDIKDIFDYKSSQEITEIANRLVDPNDDELTKIKKIFEYTQSDYRYVSINIDESGFIPHPAASIIKNKYGDCKDMTVLNVVLLQSLGIDARPALVNTKDQGKMLVELVSYDFNHMITYVKTKDGKVYWLDSTGSSCPFGEVYSSIEGVLALVIDKDGKSFVTQIPKSKSEDNCLKRDVVLDISKDGSASGHIKMNFSGNENISIRSSFKNANANDMNKFVVKYLNSSTPGITISNLVYDDPSLISDQFNMEFDFTKDNFADVAGNLLIIKPDMFSFKSYLDKYSDKTRDYSIVYDAPWQIIDKIDIKFDKDVFSPRSIPKRVMKNYPFAKLISFATSLEDGQIDYQRRFEITKTTITPMQYQNFLDLHNQIAKISNDNILLSSN